MSVDRDAVRDTARYLRNVRPVDPEEIHEYVEGQPHPAVVRQTLREEAFSLGLVEREDGTFVPVAEDPVRPPGWAPEGLPTRYERALEDLLVRRFGANWHRGESGDALRESIRRLKADYYHGTPVEYDETAALGYAVYHLPDYYAATGYVLDSLAETGRLPRELRVLDVGAGVGGPALALNDYLHAAAGDDDPLLVEYHALEPSPAADVLERLLEETGRNFRTHVHRERAEAFDPTGLGAVDLLTFCNVLSELEDPVAVASRYLDAVAADGTLLATAPADLETATGLRTVERALADAGTGSRASAGSHPTHGSDADSGSTPSVYAPTLRLWPGESPTDRGWSFDVRPDVAVPSVQRRLDEASVDQGGSGADAAGDADGSGTFIKTSVQFAYSLLRPDGARRVEVRASPDRHAKMSEMDRHVGKRVDLLAVKLSTDLSRQGEGRRDGDRDRREDRRDRNPVFKVGDGSEQVEVYAVSTRESGLNRDLQAAPYGSVLAFENVLVLWNDDEGAYNLVVDAETVVDLVAR